MINKTDKNATRTGGFRRWLLALAVAGLPCHAHATGTQTAPDTATAPEAELPPVTVSAHADLAVPYDQTGVSVTVLDIPQLRRQSVTSLPEALTTVPGVYVLPGGGDTQRGNICTPTVRGLSKAAYTLPMVDGVRICAAGNGNPGANVLARTHLLDLGTAEVLRGAEGATYGNGCMGAVIYLETPKGQGKPGMSIFQEAGSHGSYTGNVTAQGETDSLAYFLSTTYNHTCNDLRYSDGSKPSGKHAGRYTSWSEALRLDTKLNDTNTLTVTFRREDSDFRDASNPAYAPSRYEFRSNLASATWNCRPSERWTSNVRVGYYGYDANFGGGATNRIRNAQAEWRNSIRWTPAHTTTLGAAFMHGDFEGNDAYSKDSGIENSLGVFAEHSYHPGRGWECSVAARLDTGNVIDTQGTFRATGSYRFEGTGTRLFGSIGTGYNAPSQFQRSRMTYHSPYGGDWTGNPGLHCESSISVDFGAEQEVCKDHYICATLFWTRTEDAIVADYGTYPFSYRNASGHQTSQGIELGIHGTWEERWNTGYRVSCTLTRPMAGGSQIANSARQVWSADIHTSPLEGLTTGLGLAAASQRTGYDGARQDNYYTLRWYAEYEVNENLTFHLHVENITNQKFVTQPGYNDPVYGYPSTLAPGVGVYCGCTIRF